MFSTTHPDATAFAARFLAHPDDRLGRLVFADWLDERGDESSAAWAEYLRLMAQAEEVPDRVGVKRAMFFGRQVRARLTLGRLPGKGVLPWLTSFLPAHRIWVQLGTTVIGPRVLSYCPEVFARLYRFLPFEVLPSDHVYGVMSDDTVEHLDSLHQDWENFLCCRVTAFRSDPEDVGEAIDRHFGRNRRVVEDGVIVQD